jgi:hypothetical protein
VPLLSILRPDPLGITDILSGILLLFTVSHIPVVISEIHAAFLIFKGIGSMLKPLPLPLPVYYLGGPADIMSAAILYTGSPPILADYKIYLAYILLFKGIWSVSGIMKT